MPAKLFILAFLAAAVVAASGGGLPASLLTLERAFPANQRVELEVLRARDRARHSRILQGVVSGVVDFSVLGTSDPFLVGLYYTKVKLGSPPKEFKVQIDTGSDILWVTCSSCNDCPQSSELGIGLNFFDAPSSTTASLVSCSDPICASMVQTSAAECSAQSNQCGYSFQYGDGSGTSGFYVSDLLYFDTIMGSSFVVNSSAPVIFGCSTYQSGDLTKTDRAIDGIIGFGEGNGGGILVVGEILNPNIVYSPLVPSQPHYNLYLQSIAVNGQLLPIDPAVFATSDNRGTIVDSGTTLTYLVEEAYDPFVSAITAAVSQLATPVTSKGHQCYVVPTSITEIFPPVALNFAGGASMVLRPEDYLLHYGIFDSAALWCIGFQKVQYQGITILGDLVLKDKIVVYDLAHQRLGWADYDCSSSVNVSITTGKDEFINAGQLSASSSSRNTIFKLISTSIILLVNISLFIGFLLL
ncbi:eukaryotic aspartyl protease family protein [Actinidia rufa]|uniref:Eukaryotic aspartyl protease family protein n=1 Tax=Actinidia rufa TaxID=165716 RepID=A0A7J0FW54_9ERIC|nr:eukaryotic aspartyl protease family protein [Actinidia rufa]